MAHRFIYYTTHRISELHNELSQSHVLLTHAHGSIARKQAGRQAGRHPPHPQAHAHTHTHAHVREAGQRGTGQVARATRAQPDQATPIHNRAHRPLGEPPLGAAPRCHRPAPPVPRHRVSTSHTMAARPERSPDCPGIPRTIPRVHGPPRHETPDTMPMAPRPPRPEGETDKTERETDRQTDRERQRERQTEIETDRETDRSHRNTKNLV